MTIIEIDDIKKFMNMLFVGDTFDNFLFKEASITTFAHFNIDGRLALDFFSGEDEIKEKLNNNTYAYWSMLKPYCFNIIKGKRIPLNMKFILSLNDMALTTLLKDNELETRKTDINALSINIRFENNKVSITTGSSLKEFSLDKTIDNLWDNYINKLLIELS